MSAITRSSLTRQIADQLGALIFAGELAPGTHLRQRQLSSQLSVSRTPLREALQSLLTDGLVVQNPNGSYSVAQPTVKEIRDLYEFRIVVEGFASKLAAGRASAGDLSQLERLVRDLERHSERSSPYTSYTYLRAVIDFKIGVLHASGNQAVMVLETPIRLTAQESVRLLRMRNHPVEPGNERLHRALFEAIRSGEEQQAEHLATEYARTALKIWLSA